MRTYQVRLTVEAHDPSDEHADDEPTPLTISAPGRDEQDAEYYARDQAYGWVQKNWGDVGYIVTIISTREN